MYLNWEAVKRKGTVCISILSLQKNEQEAWPENGHAFFISNLNLFISIVCLKYAKLAVDGVLC